MSAHPNPEANMQRRSKPIWGNVYLERTVPNYLKFIMFHTHLEASRLSRSKTISEFVLFERNPYYPHPHRFYPPSQISDWSSD